MVFFKVVKNHDTNLNCYLFSGDLHLLWLWEVGPEEEGDVYIRIQVLRRSRPELICHCLQVILYRTFFKIRKKKSRVSVKGQVVTKFSSWLWTTHIAVSISDSIHRNKYLLWCFLQSGLNNVTGSMSRDILHPSSCVH